MIVDFIDFKTVNRISKLDTGIGAELSLSQEGKVSAKLPEEWSGYVVIYLNIKIHDKDDTYFVFDITTETIVKLPDEVTELTDDAMEAGIAVAQEKTYEAVRAISVGMGINELDLGKQG